MRTEEDYCGALQAAVGAVRKEEGKLVCPDYKAKERIKWHLTNDSKEIARAVDESLEGGNTAAKPVPDLDPFWKWVDDHEYGLPLLKELRKKDAIEEHERRLRETR